MREEIWWISLDMGRIPECLGGRNRVRKRRSGNDIMSVAGDYVSQIAADSRIPAPVANAMGPVTLG